MRDNNSREVAVKDIVRVIAGPLFEQGEKDLYIAVGCNRIYVAPIPSTKCKRCNGVHNNIRITSMQDIENL